MADRARRRPLRLQSATALMRWAVAGAHRRRSRSSLRLLGGLGLALSLADRPQPRVSSGLRPEARVARIEPADARCRRGHFGIRPGPRAPSSTTSSSGSDTPGTRPRERTGCASVRREQHLLRLHATTAHPICSRPRDGADGQIFTPRQRPDQRDPGDSGAISHTSPSVRRGGLDGLRLNAV